MSQRLRVLAPAILVVLVVVGGIALTGGFGGAAMPPGIASGTASPGTDVLSPTIGPTPTPEPTPRPPVGGTELYGYLPYWQMTSTMADYLDSTPLSTLALFSVSARRTGALNTSATGYRRITGDIGKRLIDEAHARKSSVEIVFTSFGADRNGVFFGRLERPVASASPGPSASASPVPGASASGLPTPAPASAPVTTPAPAATPSLAPWHRTVDELVALVVKHKVDGINVDVEQLDEADRAAYGAFLLALRAALREAVPDARVSVATEAGQRGVGNAEAAAMAGVDRVFLMGYDYHWSGSPPGASAPVDRTDGIYTLRWSIDRYVEAGVPRDRILLGLPLYGMQWRMAGLDRTTAILGQGVTWVPSRHLDALLDDGFQPGRDALEMTELFWEYDDGEWLVTYYDSPTTLRPKLALAVDNGLAGAGFWAMGYERGVPGFPRLMRAFRDGEIKRSEAPPRP